jgi:hypothetical protein
VATTISSARRGRALCASTCRPRGALDLVGRRCRHGRPRFPRCVAATICATAYLRVLTRYLRVLTRSMAKAA